ncbi:MAG TPA: CbiX/SirB N-terminal domain-containing protein [Allosphingosinicella sp.]|nr:CbiX/SirB N-terminal domain-containing protein [Allosphingosinicella sp.]
MHRLLGSFLAALLLLGAMPARAAQPGQGAPASDFGILVMAHGGGEAWNADVTQMLAPLGREVPVEAAFGMADPERMQEAVQRLEARGVRRIAVVRLFVSGDSFRERTEQILGLRPGAPPRPAPNPNEDRGAHASHDVAVWRIESRSRFALSADGLADAEEMGAVLAKRVRALSQAPARETVLVLAHGPGDDAENARWLRQIGARAEAIRAVGPFRNVVVETLREDWPEKRRVSEARIRAIATEATANGGGLIVIPYRVSGFGPYGRVLEGFTYTADRRGLLPSDEVTIWVRRQAEALRATLAAAPAP